MQLSVKMFIIQKDMEFT